GGAAAANRSNRALEVPGERLAECFFSSRRRHTRSLRDWSSDVCSSDLPDVDAKTHPYISTGLKANKFGVAFEDVLPTYRAAAARSEERRVGKECRPRWAR